MLAGAPPSGRSGLLFGGGVNSSVRRSRSAAATPTASQLKRRPSLPCALPSRPRVLQSATSPGLVPFPRVSLVCQAEGVGHQEDGASELHQKLFADLDYKLVFDASCRDAEAVADSMPPDEWFYGEFTYSSFSKMIAEVAKPDSVFVDLGSGCGKALFSAALSAPWLRECRGVELLPTLYEYSLTVQQRYEHHQSRPAPSDVSTTRPAVSLKCENMFYSDVWQDADLVYCFATLLGPGSQSLLQSRLEDLKPGAQCLIVSKRLSSPLLAEKSVFFLNMTHNDEQLPCFHYERV